VLAIIGEAVALEELTLSVPMPRHIFSTFIRGLGGLPNLRSLSLRGAAIGDARATQLCAVLCACKPIRCLDLSGCQLMDEGASACASLIKHKAAEYVPPAHAAIVM
jgi:Leucine Rich repeat